LTKGAAVAAAGATWTEAYTDRNGDRRTKRVIRIIQHIGAKLRFAIAVLARTGRVEQYQADNIEQASANAERSQRTDAGSRRGCDGLGADQRCTPRACERGAEL